jgi:hypothetical protein
MKNLFALFSAKRVKISLSDFETDAIGSNVLQKIRGGGEPANREEINILIRD